jgi:hypothetical protein
MRQTEVKIPFVTAYVAKCVCSKCPVQAKSQCVKDLLTNMGTNVCKDKTPLKHEEIPGLYCGTGTATCSGLNPKEACICGTCDVFAEFKLGNLRSVGYYCANGKSR